GNLQLGSAEEARGNHRRAADYLRRAIELDPDRVDALVKLAASERSLGDHGAAIAHYRRAVELAPLHALAVGALLDLIIGDGRSAEAEQWIDAYFASLQRRGIGQKPSIAYYYRGRIRSDRGARELARADFTEALRSDPRSWDAALALGDLEGDAGRWSEAAIAYQRALFSLRAYPVSRDDD